MLSSNKPKMPTLYRIRIDMTWETVVQNWSERVIVPNGIYLICPPQISKTRTYLLARPIRSMRNTKERWNSSRNRKAFLLAFAKQMGFDPMVAANWRNQRYTLKGTAAVCTYLYYS